jgi:hypothetical protein
VNQTLDVGNVEYCKCGFVILKPDSIFTCAPHGHKVVIAAHALSSRHSKTPYNGPRGKAIADRQNVSNFLIQITVRCLRGDG